MRRSVAVWPLLALAVLAISPAGVAALDDGHAHEHAGAHAQDHAHALPTSGLPAGAFTADAVLHRYMGLLTMDVQALDHYAHGHLDQDQAVLLANRVVERVHSIIEECTLPPDADQALHGIIAPLLVNGQALAKDPSRKDTIPAMEQAVAEYQRLFTPPAEPGGTTE